MITNETIGVGTKEDFQELEQLLTREQIDYSVYFEDYDPTPWNAVVVGYPGRIQKVLRELDSRRIYYETTMRLPIN